MRAGRPGDRVRWGVLSTANIATEKVIPGLRRSPNAARCWRSRRASAARRQAVAARLGIPRAYGSYEALLADPDIDAVYIPLPNHLHAEWTIAAAAGRQARPVREAAGDDRGRGAADGRRLPGRGRAADGGVHVPPAPVVGRGPRARGVGPDRRLQAVDSWFSYFNDDPANIRNIREAGGGALFDIGCYSVNLSRMLFGAEPRPRRAAVVRDPAIGRRRADQRDPRVRRRASRRSPARRGPRPTSGSTSTARAAGSRSRSRSTSRPTGRRAIFVTRRRRPAGRARDRDADVRRRPIRTPARRSAFARGVLDGGRCRSRRRTRSRTCA